VTGPSRCVRLLGVPVDAYRAADEHTEALLRELTLIELGGGKTPDAVPSRLLVLVRELRTRSAGVDEVVRGQVDAAADAGEAAVDVSVELPDEAAEASLRLRELLEEADHYCRRGELLTLESPAWLLAFRRWYFGEIVAQLRHGAESTPYEPLAETGGSRMRRAPRS
jgi:hypothetical protein